jgi:hypothetical protein
MKQDLTPYEIIARNIKVKLAMRVRGDVWATACKNQITVAITLNGETYGITRTITDLNNTDSTELSEIIYKSYRKYIFKKYFTFD